MMSEVACDVCITYAVDRCQKLVCSTKCLFRWILQKEVCWLFLLCLTHRSVTGQSHKHSTCNLAKYSCVFRGVSVCMLLECGLLCYLASPGSLSKQILLKPQAVHQPVTWAWQMSRQHRESEREKERSKNGWWKMEVSARDRAEGEWQTESLVWRKKRDEAIMSRRMKEESETERLCKAK